MKRTPLPPRRAPLAHGPSRLRRTRIAPVNRKRKAAELARAFGPPERRAWMAAGPCLIPGCRALPCQSAHVGGVAEGAGTARRADARFTVRLCDHHHREHHQGERSFAERHALDLLAAAAETERLWNAHLASLA